MLNGFQYPLELFGGNLAIQKSYPQLVKNAILSGLYTQAEERVFRPEYGLEDAVFRSVQDTVAMLQGIREKIEVALETYEGVTFELMGGINDNGQMDVIVIYITPDEMPITIEATIG